MTTRLTAKPCLPAGPVLPPRKRAFLKALLQGWPPAGSASPRSSRPASHLGNVC
jgi:hypothetical protein